MSMVARIIRVREPASTCIVGLLCQPRTSWGIHPSFSGSLKIFGTLQWVALAERCSQAG
jgi:hypothetical protein